MSEDRVGLSLPGTPGEITPGRDPGTSTRVKCSCGVPGSARMKNGVAGGPGPLGVLPVFQCELRPPHAAVALNCIALSCTRPRRYDSVAQLPPGVRAPKPTLRPGAACSSPGQTIPPRDHSMQSVEGLYHGACAAAPRWHISAADWIMLTPSDGTALIDRRLHLAFDTGYTHDGSCSCPVAGVKTTLASDNKTADTTSWACPTFGSRRPGNTRQRYRRPVLSANTRRA
jgi:hypothetical protein